MSGIFVALLMLMDDAAIRRTIARFNHTWERTAVMTPAAAAPGSWPGWQQGQSQMYFTVASVQVRNDGTAVVAADGNVYGSVVFKRTTGAIFVLRREGGDWKIDSLRIRQ